MTFRFLAAPEMLLFRPRYYAALTKLILMDNVPGRLELFISPFSVTLQRLRTMNLKSPEGVVREGGKWDVDDLREALQGPARRHDILQRPSQLQPRLRDTVGVRRHGDR